MKYTSPEIELVQLEVIDVIQTSGNDDGNNDNGELRDDELEGF